MNTQLKIPYYVIPFGVHSVLKNELLELIDSQNSSSVVKEDTQKISKTDYFLPAEEKWNSEYFQTLNEHLQQPFEEFYRKYMEDNELLDIDGFGVTNFWFQQYNKKDHHGWHIHNGNDISVVYYLELPEGTPTTAFKSYDGSEMILADAKEGDFIFFPSVAAHCSPPIETESRKTIISFNLKFKDQ